ncbi:4Fe-4S binding protein, partial [Oleiphilus sp. HI0125]
MHTVIASECTGCDLCIEPCPVDCIDMVEVDNGIAGWHWSAPQSSIITTDKGAA